MVGIPGLYFVLACDHRARFVRPDPENALHTVGGAMLPTLCGRKADPTGLPSRGPTRFASCLARRINADFAVDLFTDLVLVAPPCVLDRLCSQIDDPTRASLLGTLAKDLTVVPDLELWPHLLPWIQPTHVSWTPPIPSLR